MQMTFHAKNITYSLIEQDNKYKVIYRYNIFMKHRINRKREKYKPIRVDKIASGDI